MQINRRFIELLFFCALLTSCVKAPDEPFLQEAKTVSPYHEEALVYLSKAKTAGDEQLKAQYNIKAAGSLISKRDYNRASQLLKEQQKLPEALNDEKYMLLAQINLIKNRKALSLKQLTELTDVSSLARPVQVYYYYLLAKANLANGRWMDAAYAHMALSALLPVHGEGDKNRQNLWLLLSKFSIDSLQKKVLLTKDDNLRGWLTLVADSKKYRDNPHALLKVLQTWQQEHPHHDGRYLLPASLASMAEKIEPSPRQVALLLPLSGSLSGPGKAVRDGVMNGYYSSFGKKPKIRFYDVAFKKNVVATYNKAIKEGADYVIGPLSKENVQAIARQNALVKTLSLNDTSQASGQQYQLALSPVAEARQVAFKMRQDGFKRVLIIAPSGQWGDSIVASFSSLFRASGGNITETFLYQDGEVDLNQAIKSLLHITDSNVRRQAVTNIIKRRVKFVPRRRDDFDAIFLVAYPSNARQIKPLLNYYYAGNVPVYSTSLVYAGVPDARKDRDLNGIIFCDMPFIFGKGARLRSKPWPEQFNSYNRLYALGKDAYLLGKQINQLLLLPAMGISDNTGTLYMDGNKVARQLIWAKFTDGLPHRLLVEG